MAALNGVLNIVKYYILIIFDQPDGSTSWGYMNYDILVKFDSPDGSTYLGHNYYNNLVNFALPGGSTNSCVIIF